MQCSEGLAKGAALSLEEGVGGGSSGFNSVFRHRLLW